MKFNTTSAASLVWIGAAMITALATDIESVRGWFIVIVFAFVPSAMLMHFGRPVPLTTSKDISEARR
jgi:hypothetical protein